jgi:hypothetical protein
MPEMGVGTVASHLGTDHTWERSVSSSSACSVIGLAKAGHRSRVKFVFGGKKRLSGDDIDVETLFKVVEKGILERRFGGIFPVTR